MTKFLAPSFIVHTSCRPPQPGSVHRAIGARNNETGEGRRGGTRGVSVETSDRFGRGRGQACSIHRAVIISLLSLRLQALSEAQL